MEKFQLAMTVLLTGLVIVFLVLFILIVVIKLYGSIVYNAQNRKEQKKASAEVQINKGSSSVQPEPVKAFEDSEISDEIIAVIAAAVDSMYSTKTHVIRSVKRVKNERSAWSTAGLIECTRPF